MSQDAHRIAKNTLWQLGQRISRRLLGYLLIVYLARKLGTSHFGMFVFANSFISLFIIIADLGLTTLMIREVARDKDKGPTFVGQVVLLKLILAMITFGLIIFAMNLMQVELQIRPVIYLLSVYCLLENLGTFYGGIFQAYEKMGYNTVIEFIQKVFLLIVCVLLLSLGYGLLAVCLAYMFSGIFHCGLKIKLVSKKFFIPQYQVQTSFWIHILKESFPMAIIAAISMIYYNIDMVMLKHFQGEEVVGCYGVSYHLFYAIATFAGAFLAAIFPVMSRYFKTSQEKLGKVYEKSFKIIFGLGLPVAIGSMLLARQIILLLYSSLYQESINVFKVFSFVIIFSILNQLAAYFLISINQQKQVARILVTTTGINIILNYILIPKYSYMGATWATVISEILFFVISYISIPSEYRRISLFSVLKAIGACLVMSFMIVSVQTSMDNIFVLISIGMITYPVTLFLLGYLDLEDKTILKSFLRMGKGT